MVRDNLTKGNRNCCCNDIVYCKGSKGQGHSISRIKPCRKGDGCPYRLSEGVPTKVELYTTRNSRNAGAESGASSSRTNETGRASFEARYSACRREVLLESSTNRASTAAKLPCIAQCLPDLLQGGDISQAGVLKACLAGGFQELSLRRS